MQSITIGMDLGDKKHQLCILDSNGRVMRTCQISNTVKAVKSFFSRYKGAVVALEAGTHSPWISRTLQEMGCKVLVGNPRKLRVIWNRTDKSDVKDAEMLARIARFDPGLLYPVQHRGEQAQADLAIIKARDILVQTRSCLINHVRGSVKSLGIRIPACSTDCFHKRAVEHIPETLIAALQPVVEQIEELCRRIKEYDKDIAKISKEQYPETECLRQVGGVGPVTALAYVLTLEEPERFPKSRQVGAFLGLTPKRDQSGEIDKQLRITKAGNKYLRQLLVGCGHYILGPFGSDCDLRRFGLRIAERGGKNAKRRAVVAVARKLAVLLHRLWLTGEVYEPLRQRVKLAA